MTTLPIRTTVADAVAICNYLSTKPTGATLNEAKAVLDPKVLDGRKVSAFKAWGLFEEVGEKMKISDLGRSITRDNGVRKADALREVISMIEPYRAIVERAIHRPEATITATDVAAHWHQHFTSQASDSDRILNDQAVCFFQLAEGADLGQLTIGRRGQPTRFDFNLENATTFVNGSDFQSDSILGEEPPVADDVSEEEVAPKVPAVDATAAHMPMADVSRVFITHGKNKKILSQVKELVQFGKFEPVIAAEHETAAKPVPDKVLDDMRSCQAAVIHVGVEKILLDESGDQHPMINGNVLIEIGAAMALYGRKFVLLVEEGVTLPSNLQGLYECRYIGDELNMPATMKLLKAFNDFK